MFRIRAHPSCRCIGRLTSIDVQLIHDKFSHVYRQNYTNLDLIQQHHHACQLTLPPHATHLGRVSCCRVCRGGIRLVTEPRPLHNLPSTTVSVCILGKKRMYHSPEIDDDAGRSRISQSLVFLRPRQPWNPNRHNQPTRNAYHQMFQPRFVFTRPD